MYPPGMIAWWKLARMHDEACNDDTRPGCNGPGGPDWRGRHRGHRHEHHGEHQHQRHGGPEAFAGHGHDHDGEGAFGVRRPLRFLSFKLELDEAQMSELAAVLNDLKTERAQAAVDHRRSTSAIAEAFAGEALDAAKLKDATGERVKSAERLRGAVESAISRIHAILTPEQRSRFAYLIRTGVLSV